MWLSLVALRTHSCEHNGTQRLQSPDQTVAPEFWETKPVLLPTIAMPQALKGTEGQCIILPASFSSAPMYPVSQLCPSGPEPVHSQTIFPHMSLEKHQNKERPPYFACYHIYLDDFSLIPKIFYFWAKNNKLYWAKKKTFGKKPWGQTDPLDLKFCPTPHLPVPCPKS